MRHAKTAHTQASCARSRRRARQLGATRLGCGMLCHEARMKGAQLLCNGSHVLLGGQDSGAQVKGVGLLRARGAQHVSRGVRTTLPLRPSTTLAPGQSPSRAQ